MIRAIFFDLDDTLVDSLSLHLRANRLVFEKFGYDYNLIQEKVKNIDFMGRRVSDNLIIRRNHSNISEKELPARKLIEAREEIFLKLAKDESKIYPGAIDLLSKLKELNKINAIVSSGSKKYINLIFNKFKLEKFINFVISSDQVKKGKPEPECYKKAFEYLNTNYGNYKKNECLVVEDTENGVIAADRAGFKILLVPSKYSVLPKSIKPSYQIKSLEKFNPNIHLI